MSIARHHNEWLSLLDVSGAFLSMPVLMRALPQGLDAHDPSVARNVRAAHEEWEDAVALARAPDPAIHTAWLDFVFRTVLDYPATHWLSGQSLPPGLEHRLAEHGETLRPSHALMAPGDTLPRLLVQTWPANQKLDKPVAGSRWQVASPQTRMMTLLQAKLAEGTAALVELLKDRTGRSAAALTRAMDNPPPPMPEAARALQAACGADTSLLGRLRRWAPLLRNDSEGQPLVVHAGSVYVTSGSDRRSTGTHYTQRTLTERVVRATLDPLVYEGFDQGLEPTPERLRTPEQLLALKVCDLACGSGAFLVQTCRYLSEKVVEAWARADQQRPAGSPPLTIPEAGQAEGHASEQLLPADTEERLALARRLVAERCLYGVDINPMAVEMAKLSLWLVTLHKGRAFTFLDHAIKCGDTLLGLHDPAQLTYFHLRPERPAAQGRVIDYVAEDCARLLERARLRREALEAFTVFDVRDAGQKARLHAEAEATLVSVRTLCDLIVGAALTTSGTNEDSALATLDKRLQDLAVQVDHAWRESLPIAAEPDFAELRQLALPLLTDHGKRQARRPFHWIAEFPEVFLRNSGSGGFDAIVSNPPFIDGKSIAGHFGSHYRNTLVSHLASGRRGSADLCSYFLLRAGQLLAQNGNLGLIVVKTISEGDTRQVALEPMTESDFCLFSAWSKFEWPGTAAVKVSQIHLHLNRPDRPWAGGFTLDGKQVPYISSFLSAEERVTPKALASNDNISFVGSYVNGLGFLIDEERAQSLIAEDPARSEVLFRYTNGDDLGSIPDQRSKRWIIFFLDWPVGRDLPGSWMSSEPKQQARWLRDGRVPIDYPGRVASDFPELLEIIEKEVRPERQRVDEDGNFVLRKPLPQRYWHFADKRPALYHALGRGQSFAQHPTDWNEDSPVLPRVFVVPQTGKYMIISAVPNEDIYSHMTVVFAVESARMFGILTSEIHVSWFYEHGSTFGASAYPRYFPSDVFVTFPFPGPVFGEEQIGELGEEILRIRRELSHKHGIGLTALYNELHSPRYRDTPIEQLRELHRRLDIAVRDSYGWTDLELEHGFHSVGYLPENDRIRYTVSLAARLEILKRLSLLNLKHWKAEQADALAAVNDVEAARKTAAKPRRKAGTMLTLVADPKQPGLF